MWKCAALASRPAWPNWRAACSCPCSPPSWAEACWPKTALICTAPTWVWRGGPQTRRRSASSPCPGRRGAPPRAGNLAGAPETTALLDDSDLPVMLGAILSDSNFGVSAQRMDFRRALIAAHREVRVGHHVYHDIPLAALVEALLERIPPASGTRRTLPPQPEYPRGLVADDTPLCAGDLSRALNDRILAHGPMNIVSDMGDCLFAAMELLPTSETMFIGP